ncbi:hypothetical protein FVE85_6545 [Porphyridium purpureum]|uniref:Uncharacterized protein n=1 Tax=Porphyridium purpureum TaxID=35688 RepID=A0A5J4Z724_PORPP|nr:hypothetical protein FVE85_6545 [Porphyridium purpureum]|eukprot:POR3967..scf295_1
MSSCPSAWACECAPPCMTEIRGTDVRSLGLGSLKEYVESVHPELAEQFGHEAGVTDRTNLLYEDDVDLVRDAMASIYRPLEVAVAQNDPRILWSDNVVIDRFGYYHQYTVWARLPEGMDLSRELGTPASELALHVLLCGAILRPNGSRCALNFDLVALLDFTSCPISPRFAIRFRSRTKVIKGAQEHMYPVTPLLVGLFVSAPESMLPRKALFFMKRLELGGQLHSKDMSITGGTSYAEAEDSEEARHQLALQENNAAKSWVIVCGMRALQHRIHAIAQREVETLSQMWGDAGLHLGNVGARAASSEAAQVASHARPNTTQSRRADSGANSGHSTGSEAGDDSSTARRDSSPARKKARHDDSPHGS